MCHRASAANAWQCHCGYEFGQDIAKVRVLLRDQQTNAWIMLVGLLMLDISAVCWLFSLVAHGFALFSISGFVLLVVMTVRTAQKLAITRSSLRQLASREVALPKARVHTR